MWTTSTAGRRRAAATVLITTAALVLSACTTATSEDDEAATTAPATELSVDDAGVSRFTPPRDRTGLPAPVTTMSASDEASLLFMREEERLALDVCELLGETWGLPIFSNIAEAEATRTEAVRVLLERYNLDNPVPARDTGEYADATLQAAYDEFVALGTRSLADALRVGAMIEELDIADLRDRPAEAADVAQVFDNLKRGSRNHLRAFVDQLEQRGMDYSPTYLSAADVEAILAGGVERNGR